MCTEGRPTLKWEKHTLIRVLINSLIVNEMSVTVNLRYNKSLRPSQFITYISSDMGFGHINWNYCLLYSQYLLHHNCFTVVYYCLFQNDSQKHVCNRAVENIQQIAKLIQHHSLLHTKNYLRRTSINDCPEKMSIVQWLHSEQQRAWARLTWSPFRSYFDWAAKKTAQNKKESSLSQMKCKNKLFVNKI